MNKIINLCIVSTQTAIVIIINFWAMNICRRNYFQPKFKKRGDGKEVIGKGFLEDVYFELYFQRTEQLVYSSHLVRVAVWDHPGFCLLVC